MLLAAKSQGVTDLFASQYIFIFEVGKAINSYNPCPIFFSPSHNNIPSLPT